jgi:DNA invertase Pin-like site-specific DNA recombinase
MKMIEDALAGNIDIIITKSISRFGRNTLDVIKYIRMLRENNVAVIFEEDNINTMDAAKSDLILTTLSAVAQQESANISEHVKLGLRMKMNRGELIGFTKCYGYRYDDDLKNFVIEPTEAEVVKYIFEQYIAGHGANWIASMLEKQGIKSPKGKDKWSDSTIRGILKNEKYKGDVLQGKTYTADPISHKRYVNRGEVDKYYISNHHEAIINPEEFDFVQEIMDSRSGARATGRRIGNISRKYAFSSRIRCGFCGTCYVRRTVIGKEQSKIPSWSCTSFAKDGKENCTKSKTIREEMIKEAFIDCYQLLTANVKFKLDDFMDLMRNSSSETNNEKELEKLNTEHKKLVDKKDKLLDFLIEDKITQIAYDEKLEKFEHKLEIIEHRQEQLKLLTEDKTGIEEGLRKIKNIIETNNVLNEFDQEVFDALIDHIVVGGYDENGNIDPFIIRFVLKREFNLRHRDEISKELIVKNNKLNLNDPNVILDFINTRQYYYFDIDEKGKRTKILENGLRIRVECDIT